MPIATSWENEDKTALCFAYIGVWEWSEVFEAIDTGNQMIDEVNHPVGIIFDMSKSTAMPKGVFAQGRQADRKQHKLIKYKVTIGANRFVEILVSSYQKIYGVIGGDTTTAFASDREEAVKIIVEKLASFETTQ